MNVEIKFAFCVAEQRYLSLRKRIPIMVVDDR